MPSSFAMYTSVIVLANCSYFTGELVPFSVSHSSTSVRKWSSILATFFSKGSLELNNSSFEYNAAGAVWDISSRGSSKSSTSTSSAKRTLPDVLGRGVEVPVNGLDGDSNPVKDWPVLGLERQEAGVIGGSSSKRTLLEVMGRRNRGVMENRLEKGVQGLEGLLEDASDPRVDLREPGNRRRANDAAYRSSSKKTVKIVFESFFNVCSLLKSDMGCLKTCL